MRHILVTGANKGIGLAIAQGILEQHDDTFVFVGSRDGERGRAAAAEITRGRPAFSDRIDVVAIDVSDPSSIAKAARHVADVCGAGKLYGLVNNAGVGHGSGATFAGILDVNTLGVQRTCEAFLPLLDPARGRIVNVTSGAAPNFVAACSADRQRFFLDPRNTWPQLRALLDECVAMAGDKAAFEKNGLGDGAAYGLSKALANSYTLVLAREHPELRINACTPGLIETDMTRSYATSQGKSPSELGMKPPSDGAKAPLYLLFGELEGNGRYYGSDAKRSPLDRYRAPGSPPYDGPG